MDLGLFKTKGALCFYFNNTSYILLDFFEMKCTSEFEKNTI